MPEHYRLDVVLSTETGMEFPGPPVAVVAFEKSPIPVDATPDRRYSPFRHPDSFRMVDQRLPVLDGPDRPELSKQEPER